MEFDMTKGTRVCSIKGCDKPVRARGWCTKHYDRWRRNGDPHVSKYDRNPPKTCAIEGCNRKPQAKGHCNKHYRSVYRRDPANAKPCIIEGCNRAADYSESKYCGLHHYRWTKHGDPLAVRSRYRKSLCEVDGCDRKNKSRGLCGVHLSRIIRNGTPGGALIKKLHPTVARDDQGRKRCPKCQTWRPESDFQKYPKSTDGLYGTCIPCVTDRRLQKMYGLKPGQYETMLESQGHGCAICGGKNTNGRALAVDHDHACCPGVGSCGACVRALLCNGCNNGIGYFQEAPERMREAAAYVEKYRT